MINYNFSEAIKGGEASSFTKQLLTLIKIIYQKGGQECVRYYF